MLSGSVVREQGSYRTIFKSTGIFGGVQVFSILATIIRTKFIAVLLGAHGMGLFSLFNSTMDLIKSVTGLGLEQSAVREVSQANDQGDINKVSAVLKTLRRWVLVTGLAGMAVTIILAPFLSRWTFGGDDYTIAFACLSVVCLIYAVNSGQRAALQGMRKIGSLAKTTLLGAVAGVVITVPVIYFFGEKGIVPSIILTALAIMLCSWYYAGKIEKVPVKQSARETVALGGGMVKLGIAMMFSGTITVLASYIFRAYLSRVGGIADVGLFQAGFSIVEVYFGLVFTAMATDYYPRLAGVNRNNTKVRRLVNQQAEIGMLVVAPLIVALLCFAPFVIRILYDREFLAVVPYLRWAVLGIIFKVGSWAMGFILFAKGRSGIFIFTAVFGQAVFLGNNILGYNTLGIEGLGMSYCMNYIIHFAMMYIICRSFFSFRYGRDFVKILLAVLGFGICTLLTVFIDNIIVRYTTGVLLIAASAAYSFREIDKRIDMKGIVKNLLNKRNDA